MIMSPLSDTPEVDMAATPEKKVKDKVIKILKEHGVYYFYASTHGFGRSGVPDLVCCCNGRFIAIECKAGKNTTTALQDREIAAIHAAGGVAVVINETNIDSVELLLEERHT
jgi:Holliday junction resolvase|tara:strand:+ start:1440 stop:1775 length:336 start_codon:yes stop_codon:yes gene_type:complete